MGDEADALAELALSMEHDCEPMLVTCCWCKKQVYLIGRKTYEDEGIRHKCPEVNLNERKLSAEAIMSRIKLNF
jgi:hypothetical protein